LRAFGVAKGPKRDTGIDTKPEELIMIRGIKFASTPVADRDRALAFYAQRLGFRIVTDAPYSDEQYVPKSYAELKAKGVEFVREPESADWGTYAIFRDSEGNQFLLSSK
jgi:predicted enzyme related to lactoylglutathione lyase